MRCAEFLNGFSDFRDEHLSEEEAARFEAHRAECPSCARYQVAIETGLDVLRSSIVGTAEGFRPRLQHSLYLLDEETRRRNLPRGPNVMPLVAMAVIVAAIVAIPSIRSVPEAELSPIVANAPASQSNSLSRPVTTLGGGSSRSALGGTPLWAESNALLYEYSSLNTRYREPTLVRTDLR